MNRRQKKKKAKKIKLFTEDWNIKDWKEYKSWKRFVHERTIQDSREKPKSQRTYIF